MKKSICIFYAVLILLFANTLPGYADRKGHSQGSGHHHGSGGHHHGPDSHFSGSVWIGPGWGAGWWGPPYYPYYPPYYSPYYPPFYPYYSSPPVVIREQPPVYVEPAPQKEEQSYWYFCPNPEGYYPYVKRCPEGWLKVEPSTVPPDEGE
ncbi:MAG: hypothetical protein AB1442_10655 [Nitrospirota bacterium]